MPALLNHYYSSTPVSDRYLPWFNERIDFRLLSCHDGYFGNAKKWCSYLAHRKNPKPQTIMLDSGAFTAWNKGHEAKLEDLLPRYAYFINNHLHQVYNIWLINLDKIPAEPGRDPTPQELEEAIEISDRNYERLVFEFGNRVLPVFHQGEDDTRLAKIAQMSEYICISPRNDLGENLRVQWSADVHAKLPVGKKTHGLAATGQPMMERVPWTSVDSATLMFFASAGLVRVFMNGRFQGLAFSDDVYMRKEAGKHFMTMSPSEQKVIRDYVGQYGFTPEILREKWEARACLGLLSMNEYLEKHHKFDLQTQQTFF
jgi:hypothetical protein